MNIFFVYYRQYPWLLSSPKIAVTPKKWSSQKIAALQKTEGKNFIKILVECWSFRKGDIFELHSYISKYLVFLNYVFGIPWIYAHWGLQKKIKTNKHQQHLSKKLIFLYTKIISFHSVIQNYVFNLSNPHQSISCNFSFSYENVSYSYKLCLPPV